MTRQEHIDRHKTLHFSLDELFADYIKHHPDEIEFTTMPLIKLIEWSCSQTIDPSEFDDAIDNINFP